MWSLIDIIKKGVRYMEGKQSNNINNIFYDYKIDQAYNIYLSDSLEHNNLKLPRAIVNTIVTSASQEFDFDVQTDSAELKRVGTYLKKCTHLIENNLCIGGIVALKPYFRSNRIGVAIYGGRDFVAYYDEFGYLEKVYFKSDIRISDYESYTLVEIHTYNADTREYRIDNQLYKGSLTDASRKLGNQTAQLGERVSLTKCEKTAYLDDFTVIEDIPRHLCSVIALDNSMNYNKGVSIYDSSIDLIKNAEKIYESLLWEYKGGELAIDANADLFRPTGSNLNRFVMPDGKDRLYRRLEGADADFGIQVFAPQLRDSNYINGLNEVLRKIELNCGLYYGALSNVNETQKTAAEVISSKQRFYVTVTNIKNKLKDGIQEIIESCCMINNAMQADFLKSTVTITFNIGDSVIDIDQSVNEDSV